MKANELSIGWAMIQPDPAAAAQHVLDNWRRYELSAIRTHVRHLLVAVLMSASVWMDGRSEFFSAVAGENITRIEVFYAHAYLILLAVVMCVVSWLEGGAL